MNNLSRDPSLRTFENEQTSIYEAYSTKNMANIFSVINKKNERYSQKSFQCFYTAKGQRSKDHQNTLNRVNSLNNFSEKKSINRKPLNQILKSNKESSFHGMNKSQKDKILYKALKTQTKRNQQKVQTSKSKKFNEKNCQKNISSFDSFQGQQSSVQNKNISFLRLKQNVQQVKKLQSQTYKSKSRSQSGKRKGLECTLYEKSLQKKINQSGIKSNKQLVTVKKKFQKTQNQLGIDREAPKKNIKKVILKRKNKDSEYMNQRNFFNSIVLNQCTNKENSQNSIKMNKNPRTLSKIHQNIHSVSNKKRTALNQLNQSMSLIKETCKNHNYESAKKQSIEKNKKRSESRQRNTVSKSKNEILMQSSTKGKKVTMNQRIQQNLNKVHEKYKFILNYLTDFDIIGRLNGYQLAGKQECKWILLLIDDVYEMIKHSTQTKLKGIDYSRDYRYSSLKTE